MAKIIKKTERHVCKRHFLSRYLSTATVAKHRRWLEVIAAFRAKLFGTYQILFATPHAERRIGPDFIAAIRAKLQRRPFVNLG